MRIPARGERIGSLVINPGGPGGPALFSAAAMALSPGAIRLTDRFDIVGLDPRGVGASQPAIGCYTDTEADHGAYLLTTQGTSAQWTEQDTKHIVERCAEMSGGADVLASIGTRDAARDIDVLRAVLGDEKLTFLGQSYGTRLGPVYAEQFPQNVRAMLLDGAMDPTTGTFERRLGTYTGFSVLSTRWLRSAPHGLIARWAPTRVRLPRYFSRSSGRCTTSQYRHSVLNSDSTWQSTPSIPDCTAKNPGPE